MRHKDDFTTAISQKFIPLVFYLQLHLWQQHHATCFFISTSIQMKHTASINFVYYLWFICSWVNCQELKYLFGCLQFLWGGEKAQKLFSLWISVNEKIDIFWSGQCSKFLISSYFKSMQVFLLLLHKYATVPLTHSHTQKYLTTYPGILGDTVLWQWFDSELGTGSFLSFSFSLSSLWCLFPEVFRGAGRQVL